MNKWLAVHQKPLRLSSTFFAAILNLSLCKCKSQAVSSFFSCSRFFFYCPSFSFLILAFCNDKFSVILYTLYGDVAFKFWSVHGYVDVRRTKLMKAWNQHFWFLTSSSWLVLALWPDLSLSTKWKTAFSTAFLNLFFCKEKLYFHNTCLVSDATVSDAILA